MFRNELKQKGKSFWQHVEPNLPSGSTELPFFLVIPSEKQFKSSIQSYSDVCDNKLLVAGFHS